MDLRERILAIVSKTCFGSDDPCDVCAQRADAVMAVVQPALDAEMRRLRRQVEREQTLAKMAEQHAEQAEATIARVRQMADAWEERLPETILTATAVEALRMATERYALAQPDDQPKGT